MNYIRVIANNIDFARLHLLATKQEGDDTRSDEYLKIIIEVKYCDVDVFMPIHSIGSQEDRLPMKLERNVWLKLEK